MRTKSSGSFAPKGFTLIEVTSGIALLATLLVSILMAYRLHAQQIRSAEGRMVAIEFLDQMLQGWLDQQQVPNVGDEGEVPGDAELLWTAVPSESRLPEDLGAEIVRIEITRYGRQKGELPLASVEILVSPEMRSGQ